MSPSTSHSKNSNRRKTGEYHKSPVCTSKTVALRTIRQPPHPLEGLNILQASKLISESLACQPGTPTEERCDSKKMCLAFHLYSPRKPKLSEGQLSASVELLESPELRHFTLPFTRQTIDISETSLADLKTKLFALADDVDPDQIGNRNSTLLEAADQLNLVSIQAYIMGHKYYDPNQNRGLFCDADVVNFFQEVSLAVDHGAGAIVSMEEPIVSSGEVLVEETLPTHGEVRSSHDEEPGSQSVVQLEPLPINKRPEILLEPFLDGVIKEYISLQGISITVDHAALDSARSKSTLFDYLTFVPIAHDEIQDVIDILRPHRIASFDKFVFPAILNVDHLVRWGIRFGTAMDMMKQARKYYLHVVKDNINNIPDTLKGGYLEFQGNAISVDRDHAEYLIGRTNLKEFMIYASIPPGEVQEVMDILRPHRIDSFAEFLYPSIFNIEHMVKWGIRFGTAMDLMFKARDYYQHLSDLDLREGNIDYPVSILFQKSK